MKKLLLLGSMLIGLVPASYAGGVHIGFGINLPLPPLPPLPLPGRVVVSAPPVYAPAPVYTAPAPTYAPPVYVAPRQFVPRPSTLQRPQSILVSAHGIGMAITITIIAADGVIITAAMLMAAMVKGTAGITKPVYQLS